MDSGGRRERKNISGDDATVNRNGIHHDPLNENLEETWSSFGDQDGPSTSTTDCDPDMLPPLLPVLPTALGAVFRGQPIQLQGLSDISCLAAPKRSLKAANTYLEVRKELIAELMAGKKNTQMMEELKTPKTGLPGVFGRKASAVGVVDEEPKAKQKRKPLQNDAEILKHQSSSKRVASANKKDEDMQLDMFFQTMFNMTKKLSLVKQIQLRREIRQLVMNAEKQPDQSESRQRSAQGTNESSSTISECASGIIAEQEIHEISQTRDLSGPIKLEWEFTPSNHIQVGLAASASIEIRQTVYSNSGDLKSKVTLSSKSSPSLYKSCSSKPSSVIGNGSLFCRICHEGGCNEQFISPCCCRGSLSRVHKNCLERWLAESDSSHCELCGYKYRTKRVPKYGLFSSIFAWLTSNSTSRERRHLLIDILALLIISPIIGLSTILALQLADSLFILDTMEKVEQQPEVRVLPRRGIEPDLPTKVTHPSHTLEVVGSMISRLGQMGIISMVITMDMAYISWVAMRLQSHVGKWYTWYRRNCKVTLIGYPDQVVEPPVQRLSSISVNEISF